jgi:hypothetical protein
MSCDKTRGQDKKTMRNIFERKIKSAKVISGSRICIKSTKISVDSFIPMPQLRIIDDFSF